MEGRRMRNRLERKSEPAQVALDYRPEDPKGMQREVRATIESGRRSIVLTLDHLEALDIAGVRGLIVLLRSARAVGGELALRTSNPQIRRTLAVTALDRLFHVNRQEAA
jgi:anti-anti-sigma factor